MDLIRVCLLTSVSTVFKLAYAFLLNKALAIYLGPSGIAVFGQFQNLYSLVVGVSTVGSNTSIVKYLAEFQGDEVRSRQLLSSAFKFILFTTFLLAVLMSVASSWLSGMVFGSDEYARTIIIFSAVLVFCVLNVFVLAVLNGRREIAKYVSVNVIGSILGMLLALLMVPRWGMDGAIAGFLFSQVLLFGVSVYFLFRCAWWKLNLVLGKADPEILKKLSAFALMALVSSIVSPLMLMAIRNYIGETISWQAAGIWTGMWRISESYLLLIVSAMTVYFLPRFSGTDDVMALHREILHGLFIIVPVVCCMAFVIYLLRNTIIALLFTSEFMKMGELFLFQLLGDVIKVIAWMFAYVMWAKAMTKTFIFSELVFGAGFVMLSCYFIDSFGLVGTSYAFALNNTFYLFFVFLVYILWSKRQKNCNIQVVEG